MIRRMKKGDMVQPSNLVVWLIFPLSQLTSRVILTLYDCGSSASNVVLFNSFFLPTISFQFHKSHVLLIFVEKVNKIVVLVK